MRGKRWGYEGIKTRFRGVNKVYTEITWSDDLLRTNVRIFCYLHKPPKHRSEYGFNPLFCPQNEAYTNNFKRNIEKTAFYERYRVPI